MHRRRKHEVYALSKENLYRTAAYVTAFSVAEKAFGFLYRIILSRTLDSEGVGLYQVALSVFAVLATAAASGIPMTVSRLITKYRARNNQKAQQSVVAAALVAALCFSVPAFCLLFFGHEWFDFLLSDPRCMSILLILLPSLTFNSVYSVIRADHRQLLDEVDDAVGNELLVSPQHAADDRIDGIEG